MTHDNLDAERHGLAANKPNPPRLVVRNLPFYQSHNKLQVDHNKGRKIGKLVKHDLFHFLLGFPAYQSILFFLILWTGLILVFAGFYMAADRHHPEIDCGLGPAGSPILFPGAFAFSLETCTTVGYGLPSGSNAFFSECPAIQVVIYFQMVWSMLFNALFFSFIYARISRHDTRSVQVIFSNKAIVSMNAGQVRLQVRVFDVNAKNPVVEAHVRVYAITKDKPIPRQLRLIQPNDELGGMLFLSMPTVVAHHIDLYSLLHPDFPTPLDASGLTLRQADSVIASREEVVCPICSETYGTHQRWVRHVNYQKILERMDGYPEEGSHLSITDEDLLKSKTDPITHLKTLEEYFRNEISEVIVVVEGIDPLVSGTFQALQSYCYEDIVWDNGAFFHPCMSIDEDKKLLRADLDCFHNVDIAAGDDAPRRRARCRKESVRTHDSFFRKTRNT